jgi:hypothetical protein
MAREYAAGNGNPREKGNLGKLRSGAGRMTADHAAWRLAEGAYACCTAKSQPGVNPFEPLDGSFADSPRSMNAVSGQYQFNDRALSVVCAAASPAIVILINWFRIVESSD